MAHLSAEYPYQVQAVQEDNFGIWVLSRQSLADEAVVYWGPAQLPTIVFRYPQGETSLSVVATHTASPGSPTEVRWRNEQLREIARQYEGYDEPLLIVGDLNTTSFAPTFGELTQRVDLKDSRRGFGLQSSWPTKSFFPLMITLDHALVSPEVHVTRREVGTDVGSDHLPMYVEVVF